MDVSTGIVLAAGEGTRLRPLTYNRPKTMLPAADRPILEHVLDVLVETGIDRLCVVVGYHHERVQEHFGHAYRDVPITYVHQRKQLGSAHALMQAKNEVEGPMLVLNGDRVIDERIVSDVVEAFDGAPTLAVMDHPAPAQYGAVRVADGKLTELVERPDADTFRLINAGVYAFDDRIFDAIQRTPRRSGELPLPDVITTLMDREDVRAVKTDGLWVDATYPWDLLFLKRELLARGRVSQPARDGSVWVAESARIHRDATLQGPAVVGPDTEIAAGAVVGPDVAVVRNGTVGPNATLENVLLDADCRVAAGTTLVDCVAGEDVSVGAGSTVPGGPSDVRVGDRVFEDQNLGAVLADRVEVGGGVSFHPGALVGANARVHTGAYVRGSVDDDTEVVR
jgi:glucose-1-phosphate thymidylyltransferase